MISSLALFTIMKYTIVAQRNCIFFYSFFIDPFFTVDIISLVVCSAEIFFSFFSSLIAPLGCRIRESVRS